MFIFFFCKQKTAYEMRISDWSSDVCSSDLLNIVPRNPVAAAANGDLIALMFFALVFGIAAAVLQTDGTRAFVAAVQGVYEISLKLIGWVIELDRKSVV